MKEIQKKCDKMKEVKKCILVFLILLIISATFTFNIKAEERKSSVDNDSVELSLKNCRFDDESIHYFSFVKAGYVGIRNVKIDGFYSAYHTNFFFCIGEGVFSELG